MQKDAIKVRKMIGEKAYKNSTTKIEISLRR